MIKHDVNDRNTLDRICDNRQKKVTHNHKTSILSEPKIN